MNESSTFCITGEVGLLQLPQPINCIYNPQPDITAYELAQIIPYLLNKTMLKEDWDKLGNITRHLKRL